MALESIIAVVKATLESENQSRKRHRYQREEVSLQRVRADLDTCNREEWLQETLETEETLDQDCVSGDGGWR